MPSATSWVAQILSNRDRVLAGTARSQVGSLPTGHVQELAAHHPVRARGGHELTHGGKHVRRLARLLGEGEAERLGEEAVAREDRHVLAEGNVAGGLAAPQLVIVHRR